MNGRAQQIRAWRKSRGLSGAKFGKLVGMSAGNVSLIEKDFNETKELKGGNLARIHVLTGIPLHVLDKNFPVAQSQGKVAEGTASYAVPLKKAILIGWDMVGDWGMLQEAVSKEADKQSFDAPDAVSEYPYALQMRGDAMTASQGRSFPDGCVLIVDPDRPAEHSNMVIASVDGTAPIMRKLIIEGPSRSLVALREGYPIYHSSAHDIRILGVVLHGLIPAT